MYVQVPDRITAQGKVSVRRCVAKTPRGLAALLAIIVSAVAGGRGQAAQSSSQIRKLYVGSFGNDAKADEMRARLAERLRRDHALEIVPDPKQAEALVKGT